MIKETRIGRNTVILVQSATLNDVCAKRRNAQSKKLTRPNNDKYDSDANGMTFSL